MHCGPKKQLLHPLFYLIGVNFALRGGEKHRRLRVGSGSQLSIVQLSGGREVLRYSEDVSKSNQGGIKHRKISPKVVDAFASDTSERCIIRIYKAYMGRRPVTLDGDPFYLRPLEKPSRDVWYSLAAFGRHKLSSIVANICKEGGLSGNRTNHSLRATSATSMYDAGVDEQLICEVKGHRPTAVRN